MPHSLHDVYMIANPVFVGHENLAVDEHKRAVGVNIGSELMEKQSEFRVGGGQDGRESKLAVVICAVVPSFDILGRQFVLKFNHEASTFPI